MGKPDHAWHADRMAGDVRLRPGDLPGLDVLEVLGAGAQAVVYRVLRGGREYAMKVGRAQLSDGTVESVFFREATLLACVDHPGLPRVHEAGLVHGHPYLVMDLVAGRRLTEFLGSGPLEVPRALAVARDVCAALAAVHAAGVVHRDVKPDNIVLDGTGNARLIDFGLSVQANRDTDVVAGTLTYSPPEQSGMLRRPVDARTDLYSLGVVLFECLTGHPPFVSSDMGEVVRLHASVPAPDVREDSPGTPPMLAAVVATLLAKDPDDRYHSAAGLLAHLEQLLADPGATDLGTDQRERVTLRVEPTLAGRGVELRTLERRWARTTQGRGSVVLVQGRSGSGKTRLVREFLSALRDQGAAVLESGCSPEDVVPLTALRSAVARFAESVLPGEGAAQAHVDAVRSAARAFPGLLGGLTPPLASLLGGAEPGPQDRPDRLPQALASFLGGLARASGGAVLHLDDAQWVDEQTLGVLGEVSADLGGTPLLVILTSRNEPVHEAVLDAVRETLDEAIGTTIVTGPLDVGAVEAIVTEVSGGIGLDDEAAAMVAARTGGNVLALREYVTALMHTGLLRPCWGRWVLDTDRIGEVPLAGTAVELVTRRVERLGPRARRLLETAALVGASFSTELLAEVSSTDAQRVREAVAEATWAQLVEPRGAGHHAFIHACIREALLSGCTAADRRRLHQRVADVLEERSAGDPALVFAAAQHCRQGELGRNQAQLFRTSRAAGMLALEEYAPARAADFLGVAAQAAAQAAGGIPGVPVDDVQLHVSLGTAHQRCGRFTEAAESYDRALGMSSDPVERASVLHLVTVVHYCRGEIAEAIACSERGLVELRRALPRSPVLLAASSLGWFLVGYLVGVTRIGRATRSPRRRELYRLLTRLHALIGMGHRRELRPVVAGLIGLRQLYFVNRAGLCPENVMTRGALSLIAHELGLRRLGERVARGALRDAERVDDHQVTATVAWMGAHGAMTSGDDGGRLMGMLERYGRWLDPGLHLDALTELCWDALLHGDSERAEELFTRRRERLAVGQAAPNEAVAVEAGLAALGGRPVAAARHIAAMCDGPGTPRDERVERLIALLSFCVEQGDVGVSFDQAVAGFQELGVSARALLTHQRLLHVYLAYGRLEQLHQAGADQRQACLRHARESVATLGGAAVQPLLRAHHHVTRASLMQLGGRNEAALAHLHRRDGELYRVESPLVTFEAARVRARALAALGRSYEAGIQAQHAVSVAETQHWPHRARWIRREFEIAGTTVFAHRGGSASEGSSIAHTHGGVPCSVYRHRLAALEQVSSAASRVMDPDDLVRTTLDETIRMLQAERAMLFLVDDASDDLVPHLGRDTRGRDLPGLEGYSTTLVRRVAETQEPEVVTSSNDGTEIDATSIVAHGLRSVIAAPLQLDGRLLGVVYLDSRLARGIFTPEDMGALVAITNYVGGALQTTRAARLEIAVARATEQRDISEKLRAALAEVSGSLDPQEVLQRLLVATASAVGCDRGWLVRPEEPGWAAVATFARRTEPTLAGPDGAGPDGAGPDGAGPDGAGPAGAGPAAPGDDQRPALGSSAPAVSGVVPRAAWPLEGQVRAGFPVRSWLVAPLCRGAEPIGVIVLAASQPGRYLSEHAGLAAALTAQGLIAYENAHLFGQVRRLATTDELTGIHNRRHFFAVAEEMPERASRAGEHLAAMMIDIDHFKRINDTHGHQVGDEVIRTVARRLAGQVGADHVLGRYGGEEFAVVCTVADSALSLAEGLRRAVTELPVDTAVGPVPVTVSVGVAHATPGEGDIAVLLRRADQQLYEAKESGRNRVCADRRGEAPDVVKGQRVDADVQGCGE